MSAKMANQHDTYRALAVFLGLTGLLHLVNGWISFASMGLPWVMEKDTVLLCAAVVFLWFKADKSVGLILLTVWLIQNIALVIRWLGQMSGYLLPVTLLAVGGLLYWERYLKHIGNHFNRKESGK